MAIIRARGGLKRRRLGLPRHVPTKRFIPDGDVEFANKARCFAERILREPERFALSADDAERIDEAVVEYRDALAKARHRFTRSMQMTSLKDEAREKAERIVRKYGNLIRLNENIPVADKILVGIRERSKRPRKAQCPTTAPYLRFVRSTGDDTDLEGCLSIPGYVAYVTRREKVWVVAQNRQGRKYKVAGSGLLGRALQHELDHLEGKLYIDYLESMDELIEVGASDEAEDGVEERATALA